MFNLAFITFEEAIDLFKHGSSGSAFVHYGLGEYWQLKNLKDCTLEELNGGYIFTAVNSEAQTEPEASLAREVERIKAWAWEPGTTVSIIPPEAEKKTATEDLAEYVATAPLEELIATDCAQEEEPAAAPDPEEQKAEPEEGQAAAAERNRKKILPGGIKSNLSTFEMYQLRQKGMTLEKIAGMAGVSPQTVANRLKKYAEMSEAQQARSVKEAKARHAKH